jgi:hypothetical protein
MKDYLKQELNVGDVVIYSSKYGINNGVVAKLINEYEILIHIIKYVWDRKSFNEIGEYLYDSPLSVRGGFRTYSYKVVKVNYKLTDEENAILLEGKTVF